MKWYKFWYFIGMGFLAVFFLSTLNAANPLYILLSMVSFIECARTYEKREQ